MATHGPLAGALVRSARMIAGRVPFRPVELQPGESGDKVLQAIRKALEESPGSLLVLVDVFGGTPFNASVQLLRNPAVEIVSGVNLPMVLEVAVALQGGKTHPADALARLAAEAGRNGIRNARETLSLSERG